MQFFSVSYLINYVEVYGGIFELEFELYCLPIFWRDKLIFIHTFSF